MRILHICDYKRSIPSPAIFRPAVYGALRSRSDSHCESDQINYTIENIGVIILKRPLRHGAGVVNLGLRGLRYVPLHQMSFGSKSAALDDSDCTENERWSSTTQLGGEHRAVADEHIDPVRS